VRLFSNTSPEITIHFFWHQGLPVERRRKSLQNKHSIKSLGNHWNAWKRMVTFCKKQPAAVTVVQKKNHFSDCKKESDFFWLFLESSIDNTAAAIR